MAIAPRDADGERAGGGGVVAMVLRRTAWLVGTGIALGAGLSAWTTTFVRRLLHGLEPPDPWTFAGAALLLTLVAALAAGLPAAPCVADRSDAGASKFVGERRKRVQ